MSMTTSATADTLTDATAVETATIVRVMLPQHLRTLSGAGRMVEVALAGGAVPTQRAVLDALEAAYPTLRATIRDPVSGKRRPLVRFFACGLDLSHEDPDATLPEAVGRGTEPFMVIGAMAGG